VRDVVVTLGQGLDLISTPEWRSLCRERHNLLLEGSEESTEGVLLFLAPYLRKPVFWKPSPAPFTRSTLECGALVLQNVAALGRPEQSELLQWLDESNGRSQVVSTTAQPLFPLVGRGLFDEALYYRLNVVLLSVDSSSADALTGSA
jgi:hypothetical protein